MRNRQATQLLFEQSRPGCRAVRLPECDVPRRAVEELLPPGALASAPPPLPELTEPELVRHFVKQFATEMGHVETSLSHDVMEAFESHDYPGNVRELKNIIERALIMSAGREIRPDHLQFQQGESLSGAGRNTPIGDGAVTEELPVNLQQAEAVLVKRAMVEAGENVSQAARLLGISRAKLYRKLAVSE